MKLNAGRVLAGLFWVPLPSLLLTCSGVVSGQEITGFTLIDASTGADIQAILDGESIDIFGLKELSIRVEVDDPSKISGSIQVRLNGRIKNNDNAAPYSLSGDNNNGDYTPESDLQYLGGHSVAATIFNGPDGTGDRLMQLSVPFVLADSDPNPPTKAPAVPTLEPTSAPFIETDFPTDSPVEIPTYEPLSVPSEPTTPFPTVTLQTAPTDVEAFASSPEGSLSGVFEPYRKLTLCFDGPDSYELAAINPFTDYRMECSFSSDSAFSEFKVPGYFAADGNAANTRVEFGNVWCCHVTVDLDGPWRWDVSFVTGRKVALYTANEQPSIRAQSAGFFDGRQGKFVVETPSTTAAIAGRKQQVLSKGRLSYVGEHHLLYSRDGRFALQVGTDSPSDMFAYSEFDNAPASHGWVSHEADFRAGADPTWAGGKGKGLIGALNYLADVGLNTFAFETMNLQEDVKTNVFPYVNRNKGTRLRMDVSKLAQWQVALDHASDLGLTAHMKTQTSHQLLDGGELSDERRLYYRELQARFGHVLSLTYNLGENNNNTIAQRKSFAKYLSAMDPYNHPIIVHAKSSEQLRVFEPLLGDEDVSGVSIEPETSSVYNNTLKWVKESTDPKWVVTCDKTKTEVLDDTLDPKHDESRINVVWGNLMAGGAGVSFHWSGNVRNPNLRNHEKLWKQMSHAYRFFMDNDLPFESMHAVTNGCSEGSRCFGNNDVMVVQVMRWDGDVAVTLTDDHAATVFSIKWYNPRTGGALEYGTKMAATRGHLQALGVPPINDGKDWIALVTRNDPNAVPASTTTTSTTTSSTTTMAANAAGQLPTQSPTVEMPDPDEEADLALVPSQSFASPPTMTPTVKNIMPERAPNDKLYGDDTNPPTAPPGIFSEANAVSAPGGTQFPGATSGGVRHSRRPSGTTTVAALSLSFSMLYGALEY